MRINVIDAGCGVGKTTALINKINKDKTPTKYLFITPFLTEVQRIIKSCKNKNFIDPQEKSGTKYKNLVELINEGRNIVTTHALFQKFTDELITAIKEEGYVLIMDEVADIVEEINISKSDLKLINDRCVAVDPKTHIVKWTDKTYDGKLNHYKHLIEKGNIFAYMSTKGSIIALVWLFPHKVLKAFREIYIATYMFKGQIQERYLSLFDIQYVYIYVKDYELVYTPQIYDYSKQKALINVCMSEKLNMVGFNKTALSKAWFTRKANEQDIKQLKKNTYNFFRNHTKAKGNEVIWTTFKQHKGQIQDKGYTKAFAPINCRATNMYQNKKAVAYIANRYFRPTVKNFFAINHINASQTFEDEFALSELVQFVYRSAIRNNQPIDVYIPSKRMRDLFLKWLQNKNK